MTSILSRYGVFSVKPHARRWPKVAARPQDVLAVSTTGMRHGSVVVDARGEVLLATPTRDGRGALQGLQLAGERGREFHERTGHFPRRCSRLRAYCGWRTQRQSFSAGHTRCWD